MDKSQAVIFLCAGITILCYVANNYLESRDVKAKHEDTFE